MQAALNPANLKLHQNGKLFNLKETLQLIKKGVKIPSNTRYDPAFTKAFGIFPKEVYLANYMKPIRSSTLVAKRKNGAALGEQFSLSDDGTGVILVLNKIFQNERSLAIDLTKDNFELEVIPNRAIIIMLTNESEVKPLYLAYDRSGRVASEQTLYLPVDENAPYPKGDIVWRSFVSSTVNGDFLSLAARGPSNFTVKGSYKTDDIFITPPSQRLPVVEEIG